MSDRTAVLTELRQRLWSVDPARQRGVRAPLPLGIAAIDARLPQGGLASGGLHEVLGETGEGARLGWVVALLARLPVAAGRILWCRSGGAGRLFGPGLARLGLAPGRLILVEARRPAEALWALEEGLRCRSLAAVVGEGLALTMTETRRLQLAAEQGETLGLLLPPPGEPSPSVALTRWRVAALPAAQEERARWRVSLLRCRGGGYGGDERGEWIVELDDEALCLLLAAELADGPLAAVQ